MRRPNILLVIAAAAAVGCSDSDQVSDSPMPGMTAEEHAMMSAGGTQGAMDSTGAAVRQAVHLTQEQERALGVVYTTVRRDSLKRTVRTVGEVQAPEPSIADITPKIDGFVEELLVDFTGQSVRRGQRLLTIYSPKLVSAQQELLTARRLLDRLSPEAGEAWTSAQELLESSRRRLEYWDITEEQIAAIETSGEITKTLALVSPVTGIVLEKDVIQGQQVMTGMRLYRLADLSSVWVEGEVFEQDLQFVREGAQGHIEVAAYPGEHLMGRVSFVYPTVDAATRTNRVRVTVPNRDLRLKPGMFATVYFDTFIGADVLTVPLSSVVVTGERNVVFVRSADGMLMPREVVMGARAEDLVQVLAGLEEGETVVASANFLVDAESRLAGGGGMPGMQHAAVDSTPGMPVEHNHD